MSRIWIERLKNYSLEFAYGYSVCVHLCDLIDWQFGSGNLPRVYWWVMEALHLGGAA